MPVTRVTISASLRDSNVAVVWKLAEILLRSIAATVTGIANSFFFSCSSSILAVDSPQLARKMTLKVTSEVNRSFLVLFLVLIVNICLSMR